MREDQLDTITEIFGEQEMPYVGAMTAYDYLDFSWPEECINDDEVMEQLRAIKSDHPGAGWFKETVSWSDQFRIWWNPRQVTHPDYRAGVAFTEDLIETRRK